MPRTSSQSEAETLRQRFVYFLKILFGGNQRRAAEFLGCSQAVISKIVLAKQNPGGKVIDLLCRHPKVNPAWLLRGDGEPLLAARKTKSKPTDCVPVATTVLSGLPQNHAALLSGQFEQVAARHCRATTYVVVVTAGMAITHDPGEQIREGDRILLDADHTLWRKDLSILDGRLAVVRCKNGDTTIHELVRLRCSTGQHGPELQRMAQDNTADKKSTSAAARQRVVQLDRTNNSTASENRSPTGDQSLTPLVIDDVVAIAIELWRRL